MAASEGKEGPAGQACPPLPCAGGETETQRGSGPQDPRFLIPSVQYRGPRLSARSPAQSPLSRKVFRWGRGSQPGLTGEMWEPGPLRPQLGMGASQGVGSS